MTTTINNEHKKLNVPNLRFPEFQGEWEKCTLNEVCKFHNGRAYKQTELLAAGKYRVLRVGNFFTNDSWYYSNLELEDNKYAQNGDLLYAWSASFGPRFWREEKVIFHYHIWKIDSFKNVDKNFLYHFLDLDSAKIKNEVQGGTMVHITKGDMEKRTISYPSVLEQRNIARFLFLLDERIATQNKIIDRLQSLIKGIAQHCIRDFTNGCEYVRLGDICKITTGKLDANAQVENGQYPFFTCAERPFYIDNYAFDTEALLISGNGANLGYINYYKGKFNAYQRTYVLDHFSVNIQYVKWALKVLLPQRIAIKKSSSNTPYIVLSTLADLKIPIPNNSKQNHIADLMMSFERKLSTQLALSDLYNQQKQYLLRQMFI